MPFHDTRAAGGHLRIPRPRAIRLLTAAVALGLILTALLGGSAQALQGESDEPATADDEPATTGSPVEDEARDEELREGAAVYAQICASCHQAGGVGLEGQFPPLIDNDHIDDAAYVEDVITNGRQGEIEVSGVLYDGVMPSFSTLSDEDTSAVIAFMQADFVAPAISAAVPLGPVAGTELPALANVTYLLAFAITAGLIGLVLAPRVLSENDRLNVPWLDAWLKTAVIVASAILLTGVIPDWAVKHSAVTKLSRFSQDLIGVSLWLFGMVVVAGSLWYAHRRSRV